MRGNSTVMENESTEVNKRTGLKHYIGDYWGPENITMDNVEEYMDGVLRELHRRTVAGNVLSVAVIDFFLGRDVECTQFVHVESSGFKSTTKVVFTFKKENERYILSKKEGSSAVISVIDITDIVLAGKRSLENLEFDSSTSNSQGKVLIKYNEFRSIESSDSNAVDYSQVLVDQVKRQLKVKENDGTYSIPIDGHVNKSPDTSSIDDSWDGDGDKRTSRRSGHGASSELGGE